MIKNRKRSVGVPSKTQQPWLAEHYSVRIARSIEELEEFRTIWEEMQWHPNADIDFYLTILKSRPEILNPYILVIGQDSVSKAMLIGRIEEQRIRIKLRYMTQCKPKVKLLTVIYGGLLGNVSYSNENIMITEPQ